MSRVAKIWTGAVAYVALIIGAGLSVTFNVVDVAVQRGPLLDRWDVLTAVAFPVLVVLMVEMFVSRLWLHQGAAMQWLRWMGTISIGGIAMRVSWTHGHDFFISRGQTADVANLGPLSIDLLAIMATALILSGRTARLEQVEPADAGEAEARLSTLLAEHEDEDWDRAAQIELGYQMNEEAPALPVPVSPAAPRAPRGEISPDLRSAVDALIRGERPVTGGPGASPAVVGRYITVLRKLRDNPHAPIDCKEMKVKPELVDQLRSYAREVAPR